MKNLTKLFYQIDESLVKWMNKHGTTWLRFSIGIIFLWFGILKFFPGMSPAEDLAVNTINKLTFGLISDLTILYGLASLETLIGACLVFNLFMRITLLLLLIQMAGTFMPIVLFPKEVFNLFPFALTIEGQYIIKNLIIVSAVFVIGATVNRG